MGVPSSSPSCGLAWLHFEVQGIEKDRATSTQSGGTMFPSEGPLTKGNSVPRVGGFPLPPGWAPGHHRGDRQGGRPTQKPQPCPSGCVSHYGWLHTKWLRGKPGWEGGARVGGPWEMREAEGERLKHFTIIKKESGWGRCP